MDQLPNDMINELLTFLLFDNFWDFMQMRQLSNAWREYIDHFNWIDIYYRKNVDTSFLTCNLIGHHQERMALQLLGRSELMLNKVFIAKAALKKGWRIGVETILGIMEESELRKLMDGHRWPNSICFEKGNPLWNIQTLDIVFRFFRIRMKTRIPFGESIKFYIKNRWNKLGGPGLLPLWSDIKVNLERAISEAIEYNNVTEIERLEYCWGRVDFTGKTDLDCDFLEKAQSQ